MRIALQPILSRNLPGWAVFASFCTGGLVLGLLPSAPPESPAALAARPAAGAASAAAAENPGAQSGDWPQWGGSPTRNNVPEAQNIPSEWEVGTFDYANGGKWNHDGSENVLWVAQLGSQAYSNPVVADGRVFVGTNNGAGYLKRYPSEVDLGCLLCFRESDGQFLWQHSNEKLPTGRVHDWPLQGICSTPLVEGDRLWYVTNRGEVVCLDAAGFHDDENDGPFQDEPVVAKDEADVVWKLDMMAELGISQHNMCASSPTALGDLLFLVTSNGVDESHIQIPAVDAPSFLCLDKNTGEIYWTDRSPGANILHGQWSSPSVGLLGGVPQVLFCGGDGWLYSFRADKGNNGKPELLWKFDCNPKTSKWILGGRGTRNNLIATPVIYEGRVYVAVGQDPEHGEGEGHLWCIDPTRRGDVSPQLAVRVNDRQTPLPHRREQAVIEEQGEIAIDNPNSALIWHYSQADANGDGEIAFEETLHRSISSVAIKDDLLFLADFSGIFHCLDAETGKPHWTYDMLAQAWGSALIVDGKVYIGDEDGDVAVFRLSAEPQEPLAEINMGSSVYTTPIIANGRLYIANRNNLFAIASEPQE